MGGRAVMIMAVKRSFTPSYDIISVICLLLNCGGHRKRGRAIFSAGHKRVQTDP